MFGPCDTSRDGDTACHELHYGDSSRDGGDTAAGCHELHYSEPPESLRDDNLAIDSDSDSESTVLRPRRVGFSSRAVAIDPLTTDGGGSFGGSRPSTLSPLNVDCGDLPPNVSIEGAGGADNILRQLLSRPAMATNGSKDITRVITLNNIASLISMLCVAMATNGSKDITRVITLNNIASLISMVCVAMATNGSKDIT